MQTLSFYLCHYSPANSMGLKDRSEDAFLVRKYKVAITTPTASSRARELCETIAQGGDEYVFFYKLDIYGYHQEPVPHTFFQQSQRSNHVGIIFAGQNLTCQHPTLYYPTRELLLREADTLLVDYALRPAFSTFSGEQIKACIEADTIAAYQALFRERTYQQVTLIGKSLGTLAMGHLLEVPGGIIPSLHVMEQIIQTMQRFFDSTR